jgi:DnaK suppressor protein
MDKQSLERFRKTLKERRDALHLRLSTTKREAFGNRSVCEIRDEGDRANASITAEMSVLQQSQAENLLKAINGALDQIDAGTFGKCRNCAQEIGRKRLEAIPWTRYCITCQELIDGR